MGYVFFQQDSKLIKRPDLSLEFDSIGQKDGHRDPLLAQGIKERVLHILPLRHGFISFLSQRYLDGQSEAAT